MTTFVDDFNRANENPLAGNWTTQPGGFTGVLLDSGHIYGSGGPISDNASYVNSVTPANDQYAKLKWKNVGAAMSGGGPCVRMDTASNTMYGVEVYIGAPYTAAIFYTAAGAYTTLASAAVSYSVDDEFSIEVVGNLLTARQNGAAIAGLIDIADNNLTAGRFGLYAFSGAGGSYWDDFEGGDVSPGGGLIIIGGAAGGGGGIGALAVGAVG